MTAAMLGLLAGCGGGGGSSSAPAPDSSTGTPAPTPAGSTSISDSSCALQYAMPTDTTALTGTDPLRSDQWHLYNDGRFGTTGEDLRVTDAWLTTKGAGIRVAVIDDALEVTHSDLWPNVVTGGSYNYAGRTRGSIWPMPCTTDDSHGTSVAGLIASRGDNALGGLGVAPEAKLVGYNAIATMQDADVLDALNRSLANNHIYNNSWGSPDDGFLHPVDTTHTAAIRNGLATGRNGKGAIYVFAAGNGGCYNPDLAATTEVEPCVRENSNYDGYANQMGQITVCAVSSDGYQPFYGENGANMLVCAPSSDLSATADVRTTAISNRYRSDFTGTSASTPMVSGVVALMLAANPNLTWRDVRLILARTARQNDTAPRLVPAPGGGYQPFDARWTTPTLATTPALRPHSPRYGFGVVDATAAVAASRSWTSVGGSSSLKTCGPFVANPDVTLPDPTPAVSPATTMTPTVRTSTITLPADGAADACDITQLEHVEIRFTARNSTGTAAHPRSGDLRIRLTSPNGLVSELADEHYCYNEAEQVVSCGDYADFPFGSVRHLDEPPFDVSNPASRNWTLDVTDMLLGSTGRFASWSLTLYGR